MRRLAASTGWAGRIDFATPVDTRQALPAGRKPSTTRTVALLPTVRYPDAPAGEAAYTSSPVVINLRPASVSLHTSQSGMIGLRIHGSAQPWRTQLLMVWVLIA